VHKGVRMIEGKNRHNWFFKTIAMAVVCLFLVNNVVWAYPNTLATQGLSSERTRRELWEALTSRMQSDKLQDNPLERIYREHEDAKQKGTPFNKIRPVDGAIVNGVVTLLTEELGEAHNCDVATRIGQRLEALADRRVPNADTLLVSGINLIEDPAFTIPHAGRAINIPYHEGMRNTEIRDILLHEAISGCIFGDARVVHELASDVVTLVNSGDLQAAALRLSGVMQNPFPQLRVPSSITFNDMQDLSTNKYCIRALLQDGPMQGPSFYALVDDNVDIDMNILRLKYGGPPDKFVNPKDVRSFDEVIKAFLERKLGQGIVYKPNHAALGSSQIFLKYNQAGTLDVTVNCFHTQAGSIWRDILRYLKSRTDIRGDSIYHDTDTKTITLTLDPESQDIVDILHEFWLTIITSDPIRSDEYDPGMFESDLDPIRTEDNRPYSTRFILEGSLTTGRITDLHRTKWGAARGAIGGVVSNVGGREDAGAEGLKPNEIFTPLYGRYVPVGREGEFEDYVVKLIGEEFTYMCDRFKAAGIFMDNEIIFQLDLVWLPPKKAGDFPIPVIIDGMDFVFKSNPWASVLSLSERVSRLDRPLLADRALWQMTESERLELGDLRDFAMASPDRRQAATPVVIEGASVEDLDAIGDIFINDFKPEVPTMQDYSKDGFIRYVAGLIDRSQAESNIVLVARAEERVVGYVMASVLTSENTGYITDFAVRRVSRGKGTGTSLFKEALDRLRAVPAVRIIKVQDESQTDFTAAVARKFGFKGGHLLTLDLASSPQLTSDKAAGEERSVSLSEFEEMTIGALKDDQTKLGELQRQAHKLGHDVVIVPVLFRPAESTMQLTHDLELTAAINDATEKVLEVINGVCREMNWPLSEIEDGIEEVFLNAIQRSGEKEAIATVRLLKVTGRVVGFQISIRDLGKGIADVEEARRESFEKWQRGGGHGHGLRNLLVSDSLSPLDSPPSILASEGEIAYETNDGSGSKVFVYDRERKIFVRMGQGKISNGTRVILTLEKDIASTSPTLATLRTLPNSERDKAQETIEATGHTGSCQDIDSLILMYEGGFFHDRELSAWVRTQPDLVLLAITRIIYRHTQMEGFQFSVETLTSLEALSRSLVDDHQSQEAERLLALLNFEFGITRDVFSNFMLDDGTLIDIAPAVRTISNEGAVIDEFRGKRVLLCEAHHDDAVFTIGNLVQEKIAPFAENTTLVTATSDPLGVTDEYIRQRMRSGTGPTEVDAVKVAIREREGGVAARAREALGVDRYFSLEFEYEPLEPVYDSDGVLRSYYSRWHPFGRAAQERAVSIIESDNPDCIIMELPRVAYHQCHRDTSRLFLNSVIRINKRRVLRGQKPIAIYFYCGNQYFDTYAIRPNIVNPINREGEEKKLAVVKLYESQLARRPDYSREIETRDRSYASYLPREARRNYSAAELLVSAALVGDNGLDLYSPIQLAGRRKGGLVILDTALEDINRTKFYTRVIVQAAEEINEEIHAKKEGGILCVSAGTDSSMGKNRAIPGSDFDGYVFYRNLTEDEVRQYSKLLTERLTDAGMDCSSHGPDWISVEPLMALAHFNDDGEATVSRAVRNCYELARASTPLYGDFSFVPDFESLPNVPKRIVDELDEAAVVAVRSYASPMTEPKLRLVEIRERLIREWKSLDVEVRRDLLAILNANRYSPVTISYQTFDFLKRQGYLTVIRREKHSSYVIDLPWFDVFSVKGERRVRLIDTGAPRQPQPTRLAEINHYTQLEPSRRLYVDEAIRAMGSMLNDKRVEEARNILAQLMLLPEVRQIDSTDAAKALSSCLAYSSPGTAEAAVASVISNRSVAIVTPLGGEEEEKIVSRVEVAEPSFDTPFFVNMLHVYSPFHEGGETADFDERARSMNGEIERLGLAGLNEFTDGKYRMIIPGRYIGKCLRKEIRRLVDRIKRGEGESVEVLLSLDTVHSEYEEDTKLPQDLIRLYFNPGESDLAFMHTFRATGVSYRVYDPEGTIECQEILSASPTFQVVIRVFATKEELIEYARSSVSREATHRFASPKSGRPSQFAGAYYVTRLDPLRRYAVEEMHDDLAVRNILAAFMLGEIETEAHVIDALTRHPKIGDRGLAATLARKAYGPFAMAGPDEGQGEEPAAADPTSRKLSDLEKNRRVTDALSDQVVREYVTFAMRNVYSRFGVSQETIDGIIQILFSQPHRDPTEIAEELRNYLANRDFATVFQQYESQKPVSERLKLIGEHIRGPVVADIGCGSGGLSEAIAQRIQGVDRVIATDVNEGSYRAVDPRVEFHRQSEENRVGEIGSALVDTAVYTYVLHHGYEHVLRDLLTDTRRILRENGRVVVLEETCSDTLQAVEANELTSRFLTLDARTRNMVMSLNDWLGNTVFRGWSINEPHNHKPMDDWERLFARCGFKVVERKFVGVTEASFHFTPRGIFVLEKLSDSEERGVPPFPPTQLAERPDGRQISYANVVINERTPDEKILLTRVPLGNPQEVHLPLDEAIRTWHEQKKGRRVLDGSEEAKLVREFLDRNNLKKLKDIFSALISEPHLAVELPREGIPQVSILDTPNGSIHEIPIGELKRIAPKVFERLSERLMEGAGQELPDNAVLKIMGHASDNWGINIADSGDPRENARRIIFELFRYMGIDHRYVDLIDSNILEHTFSDPTRRHLQRQVSRYLVEREIREDDDFGMSRQARPANLLAQLDAREIALAEVARPDVTEKSEAVPVSLAAYYQNTKTLRGTDPLVLTTQLEAEVAGIPFQQAQIARDIEDARMPFVHRLQRIVRDAQLVKELPDEIDTSYIPGQGSAAVASNRGFVVTLLQHIGVDSNTHMLDIGGAAGGVSHFVSHELGIETTSVEVRKVLQKMADLTNERLVAQGYTEEGRVNLVHNSFTHRSVDFSRYNVLYYLGKGIDRKRELREKMLTASIGTKVIIYNEYDPEIEMWLISHPDFRLEPVSLISLYDMKFKRPARVYTRVSYTETLPSQLAQDCHENFNSGMHYMSLHDMYNREGASIVREDNDIIIPREYLRGFGAERIRQIVEASGTSRDVRIMPLAEAVEAFRQDLQKGKSKRMILLKQKDLDAHSDVGKLAQRRSDRYKVLALENYHILHLASTLEFGRAVLSENDDAIRDFYALSMHEGIPSSVTLSQLKRDGIITLQLPEIKRNLIEDIDVLHEQHAQFLGSA